MSETKSPPSDSFVTSDIPCDTCGYNLRGLSGSGTCPECGAAVAQSIGGHPAAAGPGEIRWLRTIVIGLGLWMAASVPSLLATLYVGTVFQIYGLPILLVNFVGPKVAAVPMLRSWFSRSEPGYNVGFGSLVISLFSLAGIYLLTTPRTTSDWHESALSLRRFARWLPSVLLGGYIGFALMQPLPEDAADAVAAGIICVELPANIVLYCFLCQLGQRLQQPAITANLRIVTWGIAISISTAAVLHLMLGTSRFGNPSNIRQIVGVCYGAISVPIAVLATGTLLRLLMVLIPLAFARGKRSNGVS